MTVGIFGTLVAQGRIVLAPEPEPTVEPTPVVTPVVDTSFSVLVLNATPESGLATRTKDEIVAAGWAADAVTAGEAGADDFPETTVYYAFPADEAAAAGLADVIGGARVAMDATYQPPDDPNTPDDESQTKQLVVVLGLDRVAPPETPAS
nr:LytR C-terminal domain-containing protein [Microbacterium immunditiarum]